MSLFISMTVQAGPKSSNSCLGVKTLGSDSLDGVEGVELIEGLVGVDGIG